MYRPTVRYDDIYQEYVTNLFHATHLDRSQIIRAALFIAGHTEKFSEILSPYVKRGMTLPQPLWDETEHELWLNQKYERKNESTVNEKPKLATKKVVQNTISEPVLSIPKVFTNTGGIKFTVR